MPLKVFLDAGHNNSGFDTGAVGNGLREQDITFNVAKITGELLRDAGVQVKLSRDKITDNLGVGSMNASLNARSTMSNNFGADLCVSIHCNAGGGTGTETYISAKGGNAEKLANAIHAKLVNLGLRNRGVKIANFHMVRVPKAPAVLIELAFIDTANDAAVLKNKQHALATEIANGILEFAILNKFLEGLNMAKFTDTVGHYAEKHIDELANMGIINGTGDGKFSPDEPIKRADVAIIARNVVRYITGK